MPAANSRHYIYNVIIDQLYIEKSIRLNHFINYNVKVTVSKKTAFLFLVFLLLFLAGVIASTCHRQISDKVKSTGTALLDFMHAAYQLRVKPLQKSSNISKSAPFNQLLQQRYIEVINKQASINRTGDDPDSKAMIEEALNALHNNPDEQERELAVMTLSEYDSEKAKDGLLYALNDPDPIVREQAVVQINEWRDPKVRQHMILAALKNNDPDMIVLTLESISEIDDPLLIDRLNSLRKDKNEQISEAAKLALELVEK